MGFLFSQHISRSQIFSKSEKWPKLLLHPPPPRPPRLRSPQRRANIHHPPSWPLLPSLPSRTRRDHPVKPSRSTSPPTTRLTLSNLAPSSIRLCRPELQRRPSLPSRDLTNSPRLRNPRRRSLRRRLPKSLPRRRLRKPPPKRPRLPRRLPNPRPRLPRRLPNPPPKRPSRPRRLNPQQRRLPNPQRRPQQRRVRRRPKQHPRRNKQYLSLITLI